MKIHKKILCIFILSLFILNLCSCAPYIEIDDLPLILGAAIDKIENGNYLLTVEVFKPTTTSREKDTTVITEIFQTEGPTVFDATRDLVIKLGKRAYWPHLKVLIISKTIATEDISSVVDFFNRSAQVRKEFPVVISNDETAYNIFMDGKQSLSEPVSNFINNSLRSVDKISKYDYVKFYELIDAINSKGESIALPLISINPVIGKKIPSVYGLAVFNKNKMVGNLTPNESKTLRLLKNKEKGGLLLVQWTEKDETQKVTLEIFKSSTKLKPSYKDKRLSMDIKITTTAEIGEITNSKIDVLDEKGRARLKEEAEKKVKGNIESLLAKLQHSIKSDAVGFGRNVIEQCPEAWKVYEDNWLNTFQTLPSNISVDVILKGTSSMSEDLNIKE